MNGYMTTYTEKLRSFATELRGNEFSPEAYRGIPYVFLPQYGTGYEAAAVKELMDAAGLLQKLTCIRHWEPHVRDSARGAETFSYCRVGAASKYQAVSAIASELRKCNKSIPAEALAWLLNELGHRTNYGATYEGGRGTYRLIKASYQRYEVTAPIVANDIAEAFTLPDGSYAYN